MLYFENEEWLTLKSVRTFVDSVRTLTKEDVNTGAFYSLLGVTALAQ